MKHLFIRIAAIMLGVGLLLAILFASSSLPNRVKNGFSRTWLPYETVFLHAKKLDAGIINFCGVSEELVYLSGVNPDYILVLRKDLSVYDTLSLHISLPGEQLVPSAIQVNNGNLYLHAHNSKWLVQGNFADKKLIRRQLQADAITKSIQFSNDALYARTISPRTGKPVFQKINAASGVVTKETPSGDNEQDFGIGSDGMFTYDETENIIFFVRYFTNKVTALDTGSAVLWQGHTIDTTWSNTIGTYQTSSAFGQHNIAPSTSRRMVNKYAFTRDKKLYVISELKADNEKSETFDAHHIIDVYASNNFDYLGSFKIPKRKRMLIKAARFCEETLLVLYEGEIASYRLHY